MVKCLVVGGNGFIGSYIVDELCRKGHRVAVYDRFSTEQPRYRSARVLRHKGSLFDTTQLDAALRGSDVMYHLVSSSTPASPEKPLLDIQNNIMGSVQLFERAVIAGVRRVVFLSSGGAIYGRATSGPLAEDAPTSPVSAYAIGKLAIEHYLEHFRVTEGLDYTIFRVANAYGPRQQVDRAQGVIPIFLRQVAAGKPLMVYGDGQMARDYIYATDVARVVVQLLDVDAKHSLYNLGTGQTTTIRDLLQVIEAVTGRRVHTVQRPTPSTFVDTISLDMRRCHADFGVQSYRKLDQGIQATWDVIRGSGDAVVNA